MTDQDERYSGWANRETWNTALWIDNDEGLHDEAVRIVSSALTDYEPFPWSADYDHDFHRGCAIDDAAETLADWYADACDPEERITTGPISDAWSYALARTDWREIASGFADDWPDLPDLTPDQGDEP
jgi:hypothetical protein